MGLISCAFACYSDETWVTRWTPTGIERVEISKIKAHDRLLTLSASTYDRKWTNVTSNTRYDADGGFSFLRLYTSGGARVQVTVDHIMVVQHKTKNASELFMGDVAFTTSGKDHIVLIEYLDQKQKYHLVTAEGTLLTHDQHSDSAVLTTTMCEMASDNYECAGRGQTLASCN